MSGTRRYPEGVKAALHVMCGGGCYRPECGEPAIRFIDGQPLINLEIAHIHALEDGGPREIREMTTAERNAIENLIWLCVPCHKRVDTDEETYSARLLKEWKRDRERKPLGSLAGLRGLDMGGMEDLLRRTMAEIREDMAAFSEGFPDLARLLQETIESLPSLDPESLQLLSVTADRLELPEYAPLMYSAAARLDLPDHAWMVHDAAHKMELPDYAPMLVEAAFKLDLANQVPRLYDAAESLKAAAETISASFWRIENLATRVVEPGLTNPVAIRYNHWPSWKVVLAGLAGWAIAGLLIYLHVKGHF